MDTHPRTAGSTTKRQPRIARNFHLTETEKLQLAIRWALLPQDKHGNKIGVTALEVRSMVAPGYVRQHLNIAKLLGAKPDAAPLQHKERSDQPSQSPDTNICDIAFFRALAACVAKRRRGVERGRAQFDLDRLAADVEAAFSEYSVATLDHMWAYKSELMLKIIEADGGN